LGQGSFNDWDEATYVEIAREMVIGGDWITPHWNGFPFHDKPPLVMWLMAAGMMIMKSVELVARLPPALAGLLAVAMTAFLGRSLFCTWTGFTAATLVVKTCGRILCCSLAKACWTYHSPHLRFGRSCTSG
jgi:4-amino-4-deoxy-L-arabinose transferase-like glycosyltransferase